jgi:DNA (cytosine-5)-methyltransferase 1
LYGIELFCGAGGMSLGAQKAGIDVLFALDDDEHACATFAHNHPDIPVAHVDIQNVCVANIPKDKPLLLFGGPPCQGFSTSNQRTRNKENKKNWLFEEFIRISRQLKPDWIVFENVKGILETEGGEFVKYIEKSIQELGFTTEYDILTATNFGIPQVRNRFFLIGCRHRNPEILGTIKKIYECNAPPTVWDAISDLPELKSGASSDWLPYRTQKQSDYVKKLRNGADGCANHLVTRNALYVLERYNHIPQGGNWEHIPDELMTNYKDKSRCHTGIYHRLRSDQPSIVIGNYRKNMLIHPLENRGLSVREAARLQSFPDDYVFKGSIGFQQQQVGNAVPPLMAEAIFKEITKTA